MSDPMSPTFDVVVEGETYTFRKPTIKMAIELGYKAADVRRRAFPAAGGALPNDYTLDYQSIRFAQACAVMELYLTGSDQTWPFSAGTDGKPVVNFEQFPPDREDTIWKIGAGFDTEVARFRTRGNPNPTPPGP